MPFTAPPGGFLPANHAWVEWKPSKKDDHIRPLKDDGAKLKDPQLVYFSPVRLFRGADGDGRLQRAR